LLVLGSLGEFVELVKLAKRRGYYTIVCDGYVDGPAKQFADKAYNIDVRNPQAIAEMCRAENVNGIIGSFSDLLFEQITKVADLAGLKWYATPDMLPDYRDKFAAKTLFDKLGIRTPRHVRLEKDFADEELSGMRFPLVL